MSLQLDTKKSVYIFALGPSVKNFKGIQIPNNVLTCGYNKYYTLEGIVPHFDIIYCTCNDRLRAIEDRLRDYDGFLITNRYVKRNNGRPPDLYSNEGTGYNSSVAILLTLSTIGFKKFFFFGLDGHGTKEKMYHGQEEYDTDEVKVEVDKKLADTDQINKEFWNVCNRDITVYNVNDNSLITCFETISYAEFKEKQHEL